MRPERVDEVLRSAASQLERKAAGHKLSVVANGEALTAVMDPELIRRVLINIMNNAIRYTPAGSVIELRAEPKGDMVQISVSDDGPGIPDEAKEHLFDLFFTAGPGGAGCQRGLGLGLNLCKSIVALHGGSLSVLDRKPKGATFRFTLPAAR